MILIVKNYRSVKKTVDKPINLCYYELNNKNAPTHLNCLAGHFKCIITQMLTHLNDLVNAFYPAINYTGFKYICQAIQGEICVKK